MNISVRKIFSLDLVFIADLWHNINIRSIISKMLIITFAEYNIWMCNIVMKTWFDFCYRVFTSKTVDSFDCMMYFHIALFDISLLLWQYSQLLAQISTLTTQYYSYHYPITKCTLFLWINQRFRPFEWEKSISFYVYFVNSYFTFYCTLFSLNLYLNGNFN
jgi:hypothetical protein